MTDRLVIYTDSESLLRVRAWLPPHMRFLDPGRQEDHVLMPCPGGIEHWPVLVVREVIDTVN